MLSERQALEDCVLPVYGMHEKRLPYLLALCAGCWYRTHIWVIVWPSIPLFTYLWYPRYFLEMTEVCVFWTMLGSTCSTITLKNFSSSDGCWIPSWPGVHSSSPGPQFFDLVQTLQRQGQDEVTAHLCDVIAVDIPTQKPLGWARVVPYTIECSLARMSLGSSP